MPIRSSRFTCTCTQYRDLHIHATPFVNYSYPYSSFSLLCHQIIKYTNNDFPIGHASHMLSLLNALEQSFCKTEPHLNRIEDSK